MDSNVFINLVKLIKDNIRFLLIYCLLLILIGLAYVLIADEIYYANTVVKSPTNSSSTGLLSGIGLKNLDKISSTFGLTGGSTELVYVITVGKSRIILDSLIAEFNLMERYESKFISDCRKTVMSNLTLKIDKESDLIEVGFKDKDKLFAVEVVKRYLVLLNHLLLNIDLLENETFLNVITQRYDQNLKDLANAEEDLKNYQKKNKVFIPDEQLKSLVKVSTELEQSKIAMEMQIAIQKSLKGDNFPGKEQLTVQLKEIERNLKILKDGDNPENEMIGLIPFNSTPELAMSYYRLYREVLIQSKLQEVIMPMYEQALITRRQKAEKIIVIDPVQIPDKRIWPKRLLIMLGVSVFSVISSILLIIGNKELRILKEKISAIK